MDSSLPVLVSRLPDRRALARLVRAALRNEVAQVELQSGPQRAEAHTLDLHVVGQPPLALLAEPAGAPQNGHFPLRLRPLYRAQAAQLYALLAAENVSVDGPPDTALAAGTVVGAAKPAAANKTLPLDASLAKARARAAAAAAPAPTVNDAAPIARAMSGAAPPAILTPGGALRPRTQPGFQRPSAAQIDAATKGANVSRTATLNETKESAPIQPQKVIALGDVRTTEPLRRAAPAVKPITAPLGAEASAAKEIQGRNGDDPRRTAPSATWDAVALAIDPRQTVPTHGFPRTRAARVSPEDAVTDAPPMTSVDPEDADGADAEDASLSVSVIFEPDDNPVHTEARLPAELEEPSLSVSVVFEPDAIPPGLLANVPSPVGDGAAEVPVTLADGSPMASPSAGGLASATASRLPDLQDATEPSRRPLVRPSPRELEEHRLRAGGENRAKAEPTNDPVLEAPESTEEPSSGQTIAQAAPDSFFDDALANFPSPSESDGDADALESAMPPTDLDDEGLVPVPPPPDDHGPTDVPLPEDDDDATLIRVPGPPSSPDIDLAAIGPGQVVRPESRRPEELTPTQQNIPKSQAVKARGGPKSAKPRDGRKRTTEVEPIVAVDPEALDGGEDDDADTAAQRKAPVRASPSSGTDVLAMTSAEAEAEAEAEADADAEAEEPAHEAEVPARMSASPGRPNDPALGRRIAEGKYVIESLIGSGAAGAVYRATHRELRRTVAIKLLHPHYQQDPQFMTSFRGEALAASQLDHPNVMRVLDFGQEADGLVYIVMEFLSGRTLQSLLDEERRLPTERAVEIMIQVCAALSVAHDHGIIHRDIKPDNIMLVPSRNDEGTTFELVKVCDFGIAALQNPRAEDADLVAAEESVIAGTPEYMSPEQARGTEIDARSDVYACGICLYELVTGRPPFLGDTAAEILIKQLEEVPRPPSQVIRGLDPIVEEVILRAVQKDPDKRHQSAREMRVELKELIEPGEGYDRDDQDELSIVENVPVLDDPASGFPGFFIAFSSAVLRFGRFERGHHEAAQAMKELQKALRAALRGRAEITFARRDVEKTVGFCVMSGTAEIVDLRRLLGSQLMGSFGEPFIQELVKKGIAALTLREGLPDVELHYIVEMLLGPFAHEDLRKELLSKPLRYLSVLFLTDVVGRDRKLTWKVGLCSSRLARDLRALCNVRGISLKKMRETRDELIGGVARLLTRGEEVRQFIFNGDLVDEAVKNLRGFSSFQVVPLIVERVLHESCAEAAILILEDFDRVNQRDSRDFEAATEEHDLLRAYLHLFAARLVTERSAKSDAAVAELYRRKIISEDEMPRDLKESIRASTLADALVREPSQFLLTLDLIGDPETYTRELGTLEAAMAALARRSEAVALLAVMSTLARHAKGAGKPGPRETAALRTMKTMIDKQRLLPIATTLLVGPPHQREAARQLVVIAGSVGAGALYAAREGTSDPAARPIFVKVFRDTGPAGWTLLSQVLPRMEVRDDAELALVEDLLRAMPERADPALGEAVAKFLTHPLLRPTALSVIVPLWGERARKPLVEALEYAEEPARIIALGELRRLRSIDEYVFGVIERFLTMRGMAGEELRAAGAAALADVAAPLRTRAVQLLSKAVEGKRGFVAMLRGDGGNSDESIVVMEAMGRSLLALDRAEGIRALKARLSRAEGPMRARLTAILQMA